jgi:hypothetical protein
MIYKTVLAVLFLLTSFSPSKIYLSETKSNTPTEFADVVKPSSDLNIERIYNSLHANQFALPNLKSFSEALKGFYSLKEKGLIQKNILTLIDFSLSSNSKRLWVIDLATNTIIYNSLVAHGRNTGEEFANSFSNTDSSYKSSLGFYATGEVYDGKHGTSLKLDGLEKGINDHARNRGVVIHSAAYVSESFIKANKRLGRSQGCPALPVELAGGIIRLIKDKSCLFIYHPSINFTAQNKLIS